LKKKDMLNQGGTSQNGGNERKVRKERIRAKRREGQSGSEYVESAKGGGKPKKKLAKDLKMLENDKALSTVTKRGPTIDGDRGNGIMRRRPSNRKKDPKIR